MHLVLQEPDEVTSLARPSCDRSSSCDDMNPRRRMFVVTDHSTPLPPIEWEAEMTRRFVCLAVVLLTSATALAQSDRQPSTAVGAEKTLVEFEILLPKLGDGLDAQTW